MKSLFIYYRTDGVVFENLRIKDYFTIKYSKSQLLNEKLNGEVIQSFQMDELIGFMRIENILFVVVVQEKKEICKILNKIILEVVNIELFPILPFDQWKNTSAFVKEEVIKVKEMLDSFQLYYSYDLDITLTLQCQNETTFSDSRFFWNEHLIGMLQPYFAHWVVVFMDGFIKPICIGNLIRNIQYILISRRDKTRAGLRFSSRGSDCAGNVSNFVETEQILISDKISTSFVQIRGNIPLIWKTKETDVLKPRGKFVEDSRQNDVIMKHFNLLKELYGNVCVVNLLNNYGNEKELHDMFELFVKANSLPIQYIGFDFHKICANNKYQNVDILIEEIKSYLDDNKFYCNSNSFIIKQFGIVRTNCIDCLDRTNVVQSSIAKFILRKQLCLIEGLENILPIEALLSVPELNNFMNLWADHANVMSHRYTQTDAMKTDFTRKGKRELKGMINDGLISVQRTLISVKTDQYQKPQETLDFIMGKISFDEENMNEKCNDVILCIPKATKFILNNKNEIIVHLHLDSKYFIEFNYDSKITRKIPIIEIIRCEMCEENPQQISLLSANDSKPSKYQIPTIVEAQSFINAIGINKPKSTPIPLFRSSTFISSQITKNIGISCLQWRLNGIETIPSQIDIMYFVKEIKSSIVDIVLYNSSFLNQTNNINSVTPAIQLLIEIIKELAHQQPERYEILAVKETEIICHCILINKEQSYELTNIYYSKVKSCKPNDKPKTIGNGFFFNIHETSVGILALDVNNEINERLFVQGKYELNLDINHLFFITQRRQLSQNDLLNQSEILMDNVKGTSIYYRNQWRFIKCDPIESFNIPCVQTTQINSTENYFVWNGIIPYVEMANKTKTQFQFKIKIGSTENIKFESKEISFIFISKYIQQINEYKIPIQELVQGQSILNLKLMQFPQPFLAFGMIHLRVVDNQTILKGVIPMSVMLSKNTSYACQLFSNGIKFGVLNFDIQIVACREFSVRLGNSSLSPIISPTILNQQF